MIKPWHAASNTRHPFARGPAMLAGGERFNTLSLGNWLTLAEAASVPFVPAHHMGSMTGADMMAIEEAVQDETPLHNEALDTIMASLRAQEGHFMVRCDAVSADAVKFAMGRAIPEGADRMAMAAERDGFGYLTIEGQRYLMLDDVRLSEGVSDWPEDTCPFWARPIVPARTIAGPEGSFQAEWRIFVREGQVVAASTYYPQAPRRVDAEDSRSLDLSLQYAKRIVDLMVEKRLVPDHPIYRHHKNFDPATIACSIDFIEREDGEVLLLEGGPATLEKFGAHPCAFPDDGSPLEGIAWGGGRFEPASAITDRLRPFDQMAPAMEFEP